MFTKIAAEEYLLDAPKVYRKIVIEFVDFCPKNVSDISRETWDKYREELKEKYKSGTVRDKLTKVKCFLNDCVSKGYLRLNTKKLKIPKVTLNNIVATNDELIKMESLLNLFDFSDLRDYLLIRCMRMGMRVGEIRNLNREDIANAQIWTCDDGSLKYYTRIISEKSQIERLIMWSPTTHQLFLKMLGVLICINNKPELFTSLQSQTRMTTRSIQRRFDELRVQAGITRRISPHKVRHLAAHTDYEKNKDLKSVQILLGHAHQGSTQNYLNHNLNEKLQALSKASTA